MTCSSGVRIRTWVTPPAFCRCTGASGSWENGVYGADGARRDDYRRLAGLGPGKVELVQDLLAHGADPNARMTKMAPQVQDASYLRFFPGSTPLILAAQGGNSAVMAGAPRGGG